MHRISSKPVVGSGLDTLILEGTIRNGVGQVGPGLAHVRNQEICYLLPATPGY